MRCACSAIQRPRRVEFLTFISILLSLNPLPIIWTSVHSLAMRRLKRMVPLRVCTKSQQMKIAL